MRTKTFFLLIVILSITIHGGYGQSDRGTGANLKGNGRIRIASCQFPVSSDIQANYQFIEAPTVVSYIHQGSKLSTLVGLNIGDNKDLYQIGREVAMQIAAMNPVSLNKDDVDAKIIEKEIEIGKDQARQEGKPEEMLEKIALGKLNKFFKENTLLNQDFIRDSKVTVQQYLTSISKELTVTSFKRVSLS